MNERTDRRRGRAPMRVALTSLLVASGIGVVGVVPALAANKPPVPVAFESHHDLDHLDHLVRKHDRLFHDRGDVRYVWFRVCDATATGAPPRRPRPWHRCRRPPRRWRRTRSRPPSRAPRSRPPRPRTPRRRRTRSRPAPREGTTPTEVTPTEVTPTEVTRHRHHHGHGGRPGRQGLPDLHRRPPAQVRGQGDPQAGRAALLRPHHRRAAGDGHAHDDDHDGHAHPDPAPAVTDPTPAIETTTATPVGTATG